MASLALWRLSAGILYALTLLLVPRQLPAAVILLVRSNLPLSGDAHICLDQTGACASVIKNK